MLIIFVFFLSATSHVVSQYDDYVGLWKTTISETGTEMDTTAFTVPVNQPPVLKHPMRKLSVKAGKVFRYTIPADLFQDPEDGANLTFSLSYANKTQLGNDSWIQFNSSQSEIYGLPLEEHVSRWQFTVSAEDSEGLITNGSLDITVQLRRRRHPVEHQFMITFTLMKSYQYAIDWKIRALVGIVNLFNDTDMEQLTVLKAAQHGDTCEILWSNDTLPKTSLCALNDTKRITKILASDIESGSPSSGLSRVMSPELNMTRIVWRGARRCFRLLEPSSTIALELTTDTTIKQKNSLYFSADSVTHFETFPPVVRNPMDRIVATVGQLLVYKVPEDTFFDPEDGGTRNLALSLEYKLPFYHWLKFDASNQEFYGLPTPNSEGEFNVVVKAEDSSKKSAYNSLTVNVVKSPTIRPTVEFQMTVDYPSYMLEYNAYMKRRIIEKLAALFGQKETDNIRIQNITSDPTTIIWYNTSLPTNYCPRNEMDELRDMVLVDSGSRSALKKNVGLIFDNELKVMSIQLNPLGLCVYSTTIPKTNNITIIHTNPHLKDTSYTSTTPKTNNMTIIHTNPHSKDSSYNTNETYTMYSITSLILAFVIVCVIFVIGVIGCELHSIKYD